MWFLLQADRFQGLGSPCREERVSLWYSVDQLWGLACREAGKLWKAWSSRLISTQLQIGKEKSMSCHAMPPQAQPAEYRMTMQFYDDLQTSSDSYTEVYVLLGDFNARVGSRLGNDDPWDLVQGSHGYGECNDAGRELLAFLSSNEAVVCNTIFTKRSIQKQTW